VSNNKLTLTLVGDVMPGGVFSQRFGSLRNRFLPCSIRPTFKSDLVFANLECPCSNRGNPIEGKNLHYCLPESLDSLEILHVDVVNLANNHMLDYGIEAANETMRSLRTRGMHYGGAGHNLNAARRPAIVDTPQGPVAWLFFSWTHQWRDRVPAATADTCGVNPWKIDAAIDQVRQVRAEYDPAWLCVSVHWGEGLSLFPRPDSVNEARRLADAGVDLVVGHHTHCLQTAELYRGTPIIYSLGNFLFSPFHRAANRRLTYTPNEGDFCRMTRRERQTLVAKVALSRQEHPEVELVPLVQSAVEPILTLPDARTRRLILDGWQRRSRLVQHPQYAARYRLHRRLDELKKYWGDATEGGWRKLRWQTPLRISHKLLAGQNMH
jgi:hypothetical protein